MTLLLKCGEFRLPEFGELMSPPSSTDMTGMEFPAAFIANREFIRTDWRRAILLFLLSSFFFYLLFLITCTIIVLLTAMKVMRPSMRKATERQVRKTPK